MNIWSGFSYTAQQINLRGFLVLRDSLHVERSKLYWNQIKTQSLKKNRFCRTIDDALVLTIKIMFKKENIRIELV